MSAQPQSVEQPREFLLIEELVAILREQDRPEDDILRVRDAFEYGRDKHDGQLRKNGENYIIHPVSVAIILAQIPVDTDTVVSAILHDVLEDTDGTEKEIGTRFGNEVLKIVEGVTKLGKIEFSSKEDRQAENFRKMFLAMADDVRVVMLKLSDRLHNMQTLEHMKPEKQLKKAAETLEIFAPLANRMGMGKLRAELEDLSLKYLEPDKYVEIDTEITRHGEIEAAVDEAIAIIKDVLEQSSIEAKVYGRVKNYYSIYKKMLVRQKMVDDIYDLSAVRVLVANEKECYEVLGNVHSAFKPIPGRFKDYIAMPKSNLYQSLHTTVIGPSGKPLEIQIRTEEMHRIAEYGIAAHWKYKEGDGGQSIELEEEAKFSWLKQMLAMKDDAEDAKEYVDSVKLDLFSDEVFVFTPKGRVVVLPSGATPVDFAYRIHTEVGNTCTGAKVNGKIVPLNYQMKNGDIIDVMTNKKSQPRLDWIGFVQTQQAKARVRQWYKKHYKEEHEVQGRRLIEDEVGKNEFDRANKSGKLLEVAKALNYSILEDMYVALGYGEISMPQVTNRLKLETLAMKPAPKEDVLQNAPHLPMKRSRSAAKHAAKKQEKDTIRGLEGMLYSEAKCCSALPGEPIVGLVTRSRGVMVHREDCVNLLQANPNRMMEVGWHSDDEEAIKRKTHAIKLHVHVIDRVGVLKDILTKISDQHTNLSNTRVKLFEDHTALIELVLDVQNLRHLDSVKKAIMQVSDVVRVTRVRYDGRMAKQPNEVEELADDVSLD